MDKLPMLLTKRFILREIDDIDARDMFEYSSLPFVGPSAGWEPHKSLAETKAVIKLFQSKKKYGQLGVYAILLKDTKKMIGTVELHTYVKGHKAELGYTVNPEYWGLGVAVEASTEVIAWGFETLGLKRIEATCFIDNIQSKRVCEKLGFNYEGIRRKAYFAYDGTINDIACYSITDDDYLAIVEEKLWW